MAASAVSSDTIAAIATAAGTGAVGIIRLSGVAAARIGERIAGPMPPPRQAAVRAFKDHAREIVDQGLLLWFPNPQSFTGEDVVELHCHGGPFVLDLLLEQILSYGARQARAGEFTERAFLNGKLDLTQAEAVADLIEASTRTQARLASRTLQGEFSASVNAIAVRITHLRTHIEASLDFPDEGVETAKLGDVALTGIIDAASDLMDRAHNGELIRDGLLVVIAGPPNAGKSSLLNALGGRDVAIVTEIPGTTRDLLRLEVQVDGLPIRLVDTAGLRASDDPIEQEGIRRARAEISAADRVLFVIDDREETDKSLPKWDDHLPSDRITLVRNKTDVSGRTTGLVPEPVDSSVPEIACSALTGDGLDALRLHLKTIAGFRDLGGGEFSARRRHLDAIRRCHGFLSAGLRSLRSDAAAELVAEDLRLAHRALGEVTGQVSSDDMLGAIFSEFCIGK